MDLEINLGAGRSLLELGDLNLDRLEVHTGAGEVDLYLTGEPSVRRLKIKAGVGDIAVDLSGDWTRDMTADISGGLGRLRVILPTGVGVRAHADQGLGKVSRHGLERRGDGFVNRAYGDSPVTLDITVKAGIGAIIMETAEASTRRIEI
jgi:hypothetical protein